MRTRALPAAALVAFMAACGARSSLQIPTDGTTGAGAGATGAGGSGGSTSSGGGASPRCTVLQAREPQVELPTLDGPPGAVHDPLLLGLVEGDVLALVRREAMPSPGLGPSSIVQTRFEPWAAWPPKVQAPLQIYGISSNIPFVAGVEPTGTFALQIAPYPINGPSEGCHNHTFYGITPGAPLGLGVLSPTFDSGCGEVPIGVATAGNGTHLFAVAGKDNKSTPLEYGFAMRGMDAAGTLTSGFGFECASTPYVGDVLSGSTGFLVAHSSFADSCDEGVFPLGPARRLLLDRIEGFASKTSVVYEGVDELVYTRLVQRKTDGAWLFFRESGSSAEVQPPGMALRVQEGEAAGEAFPITPPGTDRMATAALGDGFAVAFVDSLDPSAPKILVHVHDGSGTLTGQASFDTSSAWLQGDRLTLVASPSGTSLLVGWAGAKGPAGSEMFLQRFDCVEHE